MVLLSYMAFPHLLLLGGYAVGRSAVSALDCQHLSRISQLVSGDCQESVMASAVNVAELKPSSCTHRARTSDLGLTVGHRLGDWTVHVFLTCPPTVHIFMALGEGISKYLKQHSTRHTRAV